MSNRKPKANPVSHKKNKGKGKAPVIETPVPAAPAIDTSSPSSGTPSISSTSTPTSQTPTSRFSSSWTSHVSAGVPRKARAEAAAAKEKSKGEAFREKMREMEGQADMMSATYRKTEYTTIKFSNSEPLRLAIFMKKGQGFKWDPALFLPQSYVQRYIGETHLESDPVADIHVTEEDRRRYYG